MQGHLPVLRRTDRYDALAFLLVVLLGCMGGNAPALAQALEPDAVLLTPRLAHGNTVLPPHTVLVVLTDAEAGLPASAMQPRLLAPDAYPLQPSHLLRRDTLDARSRTRTSYPPSTADGARYFVYAHTPQGLVYWSYNALEDAIQFDTLHTGVVTMARIQDPTPALQVVQTFFETSTSSSAATATPADVSVPPSQVAATSPQDETHAETMIPVTEGVGILLPYWLFFFILGFSLISLTGLFVVSRYYRSRLSVSPEPTSYSAHGFNAADWHPDVRPHIEKELAEIRSNYERLQKTYNVLLTRHKTLIREVQRHQNGTRRPAQETTTTPRRTQDPSNVSR